jgi:hypothetical protein
VSSHNLLPASVRVSLDSGKGHSMSSSGSEQSPYRKKVPLSAVSPIEKKYENVLTTGSTLLDKALVHHLQQCKHYTKQLTSYGPLRFLVSNYIGLSHCDIGNTIMILLFYNLNLSRLIFDISIKTGYDDVCA